MPPDRFTLGDLDKVLIVVANGDGTYSAAEGGGFGDDVNITNTFLLTRLQNASGAEIGTEMAEALVNRYGGGKLAAVTLPATTGDHVAVACPSGQQIEVYWVSAIADPTATNQPLVTVSLGATPLYAEYALAHWEKFVGGVDEDVVVNLNVDVPVSVTVHYKIF